MRKYKKSRKLSTRQHAINPSIHPKTNKKTVTFSDYRLFRDPAGARTRDPNIKSVVLYLLSYGFIVPNRSISVFGGANVGNIFIIAKFILLFLHFWTI